MALRSPEKTLIFTAMTEAGKPLTKPEVAQHTGLEINKVRMHMKNMIVLGEIVNLGTQTDSRYQLTKKGQTAVKTHIMKKQPDKTTSVCAVTTMTGRAGNISPDRIRMEEWLEAAKKSHTVKEIAEAVGMKDDAVRRIVNVMVADGNLKNTGRPGVAPGLYIMPHKIPKPEQVSQPRTKFLSVEKYEWRYAAPARPGAMDHESVPSRRAEGRVKHQPMMLMASKVRGESGR